MSLAIYFKGVELLSLINFSVIYYHVDFSLSSTILIISILSIPIFSFTKKIDTSIRLDEIPQQDLRFISKTEKYSTNRRKKIKVKTAIAGDTEKGNLYTKEIKVKSNRLKLNFKKFKTVDFKPLHQLKNVEFVCISEAENPSVLDLSFLANYENLNSLTIRYSKNIPKLDLTPLSKCQNSQTL